MLKYYFLKETITLNYFFTKYFDNIFFQQLNFLKMSFNVSLVKNIILFIF